MRITKTWLRNQKIRLAERVNRTFKLSDSELKAFLGTMAPNMVPGTREENIRLVIAFSIDEFFPEVLLS